MPLITGVDHDHHVVGVVALGQVSLSDVREQLLHEKREHGLAYPKLVDLRGAGIPSAPADFQQITEMLRDLSREEPIGPCAVVVSSDADLNSMRALEAMAREFCELKVFRGDGEARAWLRGAGAIGQSA
jgi:hypothetical protein